jgi:hypothetical protein
MVTHHAEVIPKRSCYLNTIGWLSGYLKSHWTHFDRVTKKLPIILNIIILILDIGIWVEGVLVSITLKKRYLRPIAPKVLDIGKKRRLKVSNKRNFSSRS